MNTCGYLAAWTSVRDDIKRYGTIVQRNASLQRQWFFQKNLPIVQPKMLQSPKSFDSCKPHEKDYVVNSPLNLRLPLLPTKQREAYFESLGEFRID